MDSQAPRIRVWDAAVRCLHWLLVASVAAAWLTTLGWLHWHEAAGYAAAAVVALRLAWGFAGSRYARFAQFLRGPTATASYAARVLERREPRYIGHNPLGAWMVLALLACVAALGLTGWLYTRFDMFWGEAWLDQLHAFLGWLLLALIGLHLAGVAFTSGRHDENLVRAMVDGDKPAPRPGDLS
ncbi:cytochrome b/b6 domain-containing protein [uncultured Ramlibacter sp.]|uniref:cytochrome b/b6 domain-containing protein n=1 Tax=uncultured Ramlibacter sp. TaxID=260755 RepID=UPI00262D30CA|nr:cytochrome b/b6 domain-containing protein [uncultured Ramlibacter sp.]